MIMTAGFMLLGVLCLALVVDTGRLYMEKRKLQRVADTAAMETAFRRGCETSEENSFARASSRRNGFEHGSDKVVTAECGRIEIEGKSKVFKLGPDVDGDEDAVRIRAELRNVPASVIAGGLFLGKRINLVAYATAVQSDPVASFSVGSQLLRVDGGAPLGQLLEATGLDVNKLSVLDSGGLANAKITPSGLLQSLGLGTAAEIGALTPNGLASLSAVKIGDIIDASIDVMTGGDALKTDLRALRDAVRLNPALKDVTVKLGSDESTSGLFTLLTTDGPIGSAVDAAVNVGDLIKTSLAIGASGRGLSVPSLNIAGVDIQIGIVEPPSIGIGGRGTKAYNAQVRLYIDIDTNKVPIVSTLLGALNTRLHLPVYVDVINGYGTIDKISCDTEPRTVDISVSSNILDACIGRVDSSAKWSTKDVCGASLQDEQLIKLLGLNVLTSHTNLAALPFTDTTSGLEMKVGDIRSSKPNDLQIGDTLEGISNGLLDVLDDLLQPPANSNDEISTSIASTYLEQTKKNNGQYDVDKAIKFLKTGDPDTGSTGSGLNSLGTWTITKGVPRVCGLIFTCWDDGSVWDSFKATTVPSGGLLGLLVGDIILGGVVTNSCAGLVSGILDYNGCVKRNLASYLKSKPGGLKGVDIGAGSSVSCSGLLCLLLKPAIALLKPILNSVGSLLSGALVNLLGLELGRTDIELRSLECGTGKLVI